MGIEKVLARLVVVERNIEQYILPEVGSVQEGVILGFFDDAIKAAEEEYGLTADFVNQKGEVLVGNFYESVMLYFEDFCLDAGVFWAKAKGVLVRNIGEENPFIYDLLRDEMGLFLVTGAIQLGIAPCRDAYIAIGERAGREDYADKEEQTEEEIYTEEQAQTNANITELEAELQQAKARIAELEEALALCTEERNKAIDDLRDKAPNGTKPRHEYGTTNVQRIEALCLLLAKLEGLQPTEILGMVNTPGANPVPGLGKVASAICGVASAGTRLTEVRKTVGSGGTTIEDTGNRLGLISDINEVVKDVRAIRKK